MENYLHELFHEIFLHGILDTLKILPFLFATYLLMELLEHKASDKVRTALERSGKAGPLCGGLLGVVPQCGFSVAGANFYTGRVITLGTLVAIFLSTSDEMLPIMISGKLGAGEIFTILAYKCAVAVLVGFAIDLVMRLTRRHDSSHHHIHEMCEDGNCHCERGILRSALHHTLTIGVFLLLVTLAINALVFFIGEDKISAVMYDRPFISHLISAMLGLIPNCAISVALTDFCIQGFITAGTMLSGLFSGAGVGVLVLFKMNKSIKENLLVVSILVICGLLFGMLFDLIFPSFLL